MLAFVKSQHSLDQMHFAGRLRSCMGDLVLSRVGSCRAVRQYLAGTSRCFCEVRLGTDLVYGEFYREIGV
jgi:hypothetical protein